MKNDRTESRRGGEDERHKCQKSKIKKEGRWGDGVMRGGKAKENKNQYKKAYGWCVKSQKRGRQCQKAI